MRKQLVILKKSKGGVMSDRNFAFITVACIVCIVCTIVFVASGMCQDSKKPVKVNNAVCPVTGDPVDMKNPVTVENNGKVYNLCCPMCTAPFKSDPAKYSKIAEDQAKGIKK